MLLSIIVPVYNVEEYISSCLESIINQELDQNEFEILVVDDGSTDKSSAIVAELVKKHKNIAVYTQNNLGVGAARKTGKQYARGKYLYFLDGDDYIAANSLKPLLEALENYHLDILGFETLVTDRMDLNSPTNTLDNNFVPTIQNGIDFIGNNPNYRVEVWWYIVNRSFLEQSLLTFENNMFVNDSYFTPSLFLKASRVAFIPLDVHRYVQRPNSITSKKNRAHYQKHINDLEFAVFKMQDIMDQLPANCTRARLTIKIKQESYVFFSFLRFAKADMKLSYFNALYKRYCAIGAYPLPNLSKDITYQSFIFKVLIPIFNRYLLLYPTIIGARLFFRIQRNLADL